MSSQLLIQHYLNDLQTLRRVSGSSRESVVREAFKTLLKDIGRSHDLTFVPEYEYQTLQKTRVYPDGALLHELRVPFGYWEAKDEEDDLDREIDKKFRKGYPQDNIIFEDSRQAVLIQNKQEVMRCDVDDPVKLEHFLDLFFSYERPEIAEFRKAIGIFKGDLPAVLKALRDMIDAAERDNLKFSSAATKFLKQAQDTINPNVTAADVREMLIQHILTEEIFSQIFDNADFHRRNNVARELYALEETFFTGGLKHKTLAGLRPYYAAIKSAAALVTGHHEKQKFLKNIYENFYKIYDKKKADRLGVVYTPNEIVRFIIEGADWLCQKHFGKALIDQNVEILDPAVGTGTFITELIEHFRGQPSKLRYKYLEELHANEVSILPYYVANLNIEATYSAINGYEEYPNLCFVDTLDNTAALRMHKGQQGDLFGAVSEENVTRIKRQNKKKISVVIGNPPYNANQLNENENNKNREYPEIDLRIKETYITASTAQKTKLYDMYARFFRWASDRIDENGIVAFVTNRSLVESRTFDGFRKIVAQEFNEIYVVDLGGDVRADPRLSGTKHNVFGIQTGVAISFMVKHAKQKGCRIYYCRRPQLETALEKLEFISNANLEAIPLEEIRPNNRNDWINQSSEQLESLLPIANKETKSTRIAAQERAIFKLFVSGIKTNRDEWSYDFERDAERSKSDFFQQFLLSQIDKARFGQFDTTIKWSRDLKAKVHSPKFSYDRARIIPSNWRPWTKRWFAASKTMNDIFYDLHFRVYGHSLNEYNEAINVSGTSAMKPFQVLGTSGICDYEFVEKTNTYPRFRFSEAGEKIDNITDWALTEFRQHYKGATRSKRLITKDDIFYYVYSILHDPLYRAKYAIDLRRELPRIPFYADFWKWAQWGEKLLKLHIGYETVEPWPLQRIDTPDERSRNAGLPPKAMLKANKDSGNIQIDTETQLAGVPPVAWNYQLGNRSALEWILDQHKEKTPKDATIFQMFNTYRFTNHKEKVIDLLKRVTRVSVDTMEIVKLMRASSDLK